MPAPVTGTPMKNFGWPCFEGSGRHGGWDNLDMTPSARTFYSRRRRCTPRLTSPTSTASRSTAATPAATAARPSPAWPSIPSRAATTPPYRNKLFFADISRDCIYVVFPAQQRAAQTTAPAPTSSPAPANPVDLQIGPNNDLFYVDYGGKGAAAAPTRAAARFTGSLPGAHRHRHGQPHLGLRPARRELHRIDVHPGRSPATP